MGAGASRGVAASVEAASAAELASALSGLSAETKTKLTAALGAAPAAVGTTPQIIKQSDEAKALMKARGWDTGYVVFGAGPSEATVRVLTAVALVKKADYKQVEISFDDTKLGDEPKMGVKSDEWKLLSAGVSKMPALAIDGVLMMGSTEIVKKLAMDTGAPAEVMELIDLSAAASDRIIDGVKHWGWSALHASTGYAMVNQEHYTAFGEGQQTAEWEKETCRVLDKFMKCLEGKLAAKPAVNGFFVGNALTLADCALINWYLTLAAITGLDVDSRYPKFAENFKKLKEINPPGASHHFEHFPGFGQYCAGANKEARERGFDINKAMP